MESSINGKSDQDMGYDIVVYKFNWTNTNWKQWGIGLGCGGNAKNRMKLIRTVILGYKMKNQLSIDSMLVGTDL